jgi:hypothetical protein
MTRISANQTRTLIREAKEKIANNSIRTPNHSASSANTMIASSHTINRTRWHEYGEYYTTQTAPSESSYVVIYQLINSNISCKIKDAETCLRCPAFGKCTTAERGRGVIRLDEEELRERLEREYNLSENQAIYRRWQEKVELVFGHIKRNLEVSSFLLRGFEGVRAEMAILSICFNVRRMTSLLGRKALIEKLKNALQTQCSLIFNLNMEKVG